MDCLFTLRNTIHSKRSRRQGLLETYNAQKLTQKIDELAFNEPKYIKEQL